MEDNNLLNNDNLSKCCNCNDAPGDFILESCLHNLCSYCITSCLEIRDMYICPRCTARSKIATNIFLPMLGKQLVDNCNWCEVGNESNCATGYCNECDAYLCPECIKGHCRMPQFRSHFVKLKTENDGKTTRNCDSHPNEALDIYCETCEKLTCRDCQLSLHKEHRHQWIGEKAKELESSLIGLKTKLNDRLNEINDFSTSVVANRESLFDNVKIARHDLTSYIDKFKKCQEDFFEKLELDLDNEASNREQKLIEIGRQINKSKESLQHCLNLLIKVSSSREPSLLINLTPKLLKSVYAIMDRFENDNSSFQPFLDIEYSESRFVSNKTPEEVLKEIVYTRFGSAEDQHCKNEPELPDDYGHQLHLNGRDVEDLIEEGPSRELCSMCDEPGMVISCASCEEVFHQNCHVPRLNQLPTSGDWLCTRCNNPKKFILEPSDRSLSHKGRLNKKERKIVARIFLELLQFNDWSIFVNEESVKSPQLLDLEKIRFNLENKIYTSIDRFVADIRQLFRQTLLIEQSPEVIMKVSRFERKFNSLLQKYISNDVKVELHV